MAAPLPSETQTDANEDVASTNIAPPLLAEPTMSIDLNQRKFAAFKKRQKLGIPLSGIINEMRASNFTPHEIAAFTGIPISTKKRYDEQIKKQKQKYKTFVKNESKISINMVVIEAYVKSLQNEDTNMVALFSIIPMGVIHLCYKYCRQFKEYLILLYEKRDRYNNRTAALEAKMLSLTDYTNDFDIRNVNLSKKIKHFTANPAVDKQQMIKQTLNVDTKYNAGFRAHDIYISHLYLSKQVMESMHSQSKSTQAMDDDIYNQRRMYCGMFESHYNRVNAYSSDQYVENILMLYFNSPYFYDYPATQKEHLYNYYMLPPLDYTQGQHTQKLFYIPSSNQLLRFGAKDINVLDIYNMKWLRTKDTPGISMHNVSRVYPSLCLNMDKLFIIGGRISNSTGSSSYRSSSITKTVECLDCSKLQDIDDEIQTVQMSSELNVARSNASCDIMDIKNGMFVIGGGKNQDYRYSDEAANSIEFYDHTKDKWLLQEQRTIHQHFNPRLWCSGNLIFMVGNNLNSQTTMDVGYLNPIEFMDIREKVWKQLDKKNVEKLFNFYTTKHMYDYKCLGMYI
eukprot:645657_1